MRTRHLTGLAALCLAPASAMALGLDRSGQPVEVLFEDGNYFQFSVSRVFPSVDGTDTLGFDTGNVAEDFNQIGAGVKFQLTDELSLGFIAGQPYGVDVEYPDDRSLLLGGTIAQADSSELLAIARYEFTDNFSVHGGLRYTWLEADVRLSGLAYGGLNGYEVSLDRDGDMGVVAGIAYERPEIALLVALTYFGKTEHQHDTRETLNGVGVGDIPAAALGLPVNPFSTESTTVVETPEAINLDFQTGLNERTLLFGQIRYAWYGDVLVSPTFYDAADQPASPNTSLTQVEDNYAVTLGIGRALTEDLSGAISVRYVAKDDDDLVSPLSPINGQTALNLGLSYDVNEQVTISGGLRYAWLGDAEPETGTPDVARADFEDNHLIGIGLQLGYRF